MAKMPSNLDIYINATCACRVLSPDNKPVLCWFHEAEAEKLKASNDRVGLHQLMRELLEKARARQFVLPTNHWKLGYDYAATDVAVMAAVYGSPTGRIVQHNPPIQSIKPDTEGERRMERREVIQAQLKRLQKELAILDRFPERDPFDDGIVLVFERVFGAVWDDVADSDTITKYTYAALRVNGRWYLTHGGSRTHSTYTWAELTEWLGESVGEIVVMTEDISLEGFVQRKEANKHPVAASSQSDWVSDEPSYGGKDPATYTPVEMQ